MVRGDLGGFRFLRCESSSAAGFSSKLMLTSARFLNINKIMAIRRCPYCKAIIDEGSEYCSNCGTQLLFPEDESVEEETPGEKIVDEDVQEEDTSPTEETKPSSERSSADKRRKKEKGKKEEGIIEEEMAAGIQDLSELDEKDEDESAAEPDKGISPEEEEVPEFKTEDLENIVDSEEKEKAEIEKFLKSLKEEREEWEGEIPPTDEFPPWAEKIKEEQPGEGTAVEEQKDEEEQKAEVIEEKDEGYPAEETMQPEDQAEIEDGEAAEILEEELEEEAFEQELVQEEEPVMAEPTEDEPAKEEASMPDTGMGLPEGLEQERLPFETKPAEAYEEEEKRTPSQMSVCLKSRAFDVLFIAAIWIVTLHIASRMLSTNLFRLISVSALSVFALYLVLLAVYFFLFYFFLGQTLGDHLFTQEE